MHLTEAGGLMYEHVSTALRSYEKGLAAARETLGNVNSELKLGTIYAMQGKFFSEAISEFQEACTFNPLIKIEQAYSRELIARVHKGSIDAAFASLVNEAKDLKKVVCWSQPLVLAVNSKSKLAERSSITLEELAGLEISTYNKESPVYNGVNSLARKNGLNLSYSFDDEITMSSMVTANPNVAAMFCHSFLVKAFEDVVCLPIRGVPADFHKVYLMSRRESQPKVVEEFIDFMGQYRFPNVLLSE